MGALSLIIGIIVLLYQAIKFYGKDQTATNFVNGFVVFAILLILAPTIGTIADALGVFDENILSLIAISDYSWLLDLLYTLIKIALLLIVMFGCIYGYKAIEENEAKGKRAVADVEARRLGYADAAEREKEETVVKQQREKREKIERDYDSLRSYFNNKIYTKEIARLDEENRLKIQLACKLAGVYIKDDLSKVVDYLIRFEASGALMPIKFPKYEEISAEDKRVIAKTLKQFNDINTYPWDEKRKEFAKRLSFSYGSNTKDAFYIGLMELDVYGKLVSDFTIKGIPMKAPLYLDEDTGELLFNAENAPTKSKKAYETEMYFYNRYTKYINDILDEYKDEGEI